jgi:hypothetical protein
MIFPGGGGQAEFQKMKTGRRRVQSNTVSARPTERELSQLAAAPFVESRSKIQPLIAIVGAADWDKPRSRYSVQLHPPAYVHKLHP